MTREGNSPHRTTLLDVARRAGVSRTAASFALSGRNGRGPSGSPATIERVQQAARELQYSPDRIARAMRIGRSETIVLALGTAADPWGMALTQSVRALAEPHGLSTVTLADETWSRFLASFPSDCAFVTSTDFEKDGLPKVKDLVNSGVQIVAFSVTAEPENFDVISSDPKPAVAAAFQRLRSRHDTVALLTRSSPNNPRRMSRAGEFRKAAANASDEVSANLIFSAGTSLSQALTASRRLLESPNRPTAIVTGTAYIAMALYSAAQALGIQVPDDLEIISIGDAPESLLLGNSISYYGVDNVFFRIAQVIVNRALSGDRHPYAKHTFTWEFFPGSTTVEPTTKQVSAQDHEI